MFHRISSFFFGILSYLAFFVTLLYFMGWIVGIGVPTTLDAPATSTTWSVSYTHLDVYKRQAGP